MAHQIQLSSPWEFEWLTPPPDGQSAAGRLTLPLDWQARWGSAPGTVACRRWFHRPTNLDADEEVWLVAEGLHGCRQVLLNGELLVEPAVGEASLELDLTARLRLRNQLSMEMAFAAEQPGPTGIAGPVWLEIRTKQRREPGQAASTEDAQTAE